MPPEQTQATTPATQAAPSTTPAQPAPTHVSVIPQVNTEVPAVMPKKSFDLKSILLPKKETAASVDSAQRVNAAVVLEAANAIPEASQNAGPKPGALPPMPPKKPDTTPTIQTYQGDIESTVAGKNISLAEIAAAQTRNTNIDEAVTTEHKKHFQWIRILEVGGGVFLILAVIAGAVFVLKPSGNTPAINGQVVASSFISVDTVSLIPVTSDEQTDTFVKALEDARTKVSLSLGLVARLVPEISEVVPGSNVQTPQPVALSTQQFFALVAPEAPDSLVRSLNPDFLLGVHSFAQNQPFLLFKTSDYAQAYAGMLALEPSLWQDLEPFFTQTISPKNPNNPTQIDNTPQILTGTPFTDEVVANHDSRVVKNAAGDILILWSFVDRNTLVITTNEYTLGEVISRLANAPTVPVPGI